MLGVWVDIPILDAICNRVNTRARSIWWYLVTHYDSLPICKEKLIRDLKLHKDVFHRAMSELQDYGLGYYDKKDQVVDLFNHQFKKNRHGIEIQGRGVSPIDWGHGEGAANEPNATK